jgi:CRISPR/Cas system-associated endonuclease Cas1
LESTAISLTTALLSELIKNNVKIIFCDEKHNPESELCPYYGSYNNSKKVKNQIDWNAKTKADVWAHIIKQKIKTEQT